MEAVASPLANGLQHLGGTAAKARQPMRCSQCSGDMISLDNQFHCGQCGLTEVEGLLRRVAELEIENTNLKQQHDKWSRLFGQANLSEVKKPEPQQTDKNPKNPKKT